MKKKSQSSSKQGSEKNRGNSDHTFTLHHQRLYHALSLGLRSYGDKGRKWHSSDIEIHRLVLRSIYAFLDCISAETLKHPLVKESIGDMVGALEGILQFRNEATLSLLSDVAVKMVNIVPTLVMQSYVLDLVRPLTTLLTSHHLHAAVSCATALELIISNLNSKIEGEVWKIMKKTNTVIHIVNNIQGFSNGTAPIEYYLKMVSLLSKILRRWQPSRFLVWNDAKLMEVLGVISLDPDISVKFAVLQLYSALALCGNGAQKLLENAETVLPMMVQCMDRSNSVSVQLEGFELARCLAMNEHGCSKVMALCCVPITKAIVEVMRSWGSLSGRIPLLLTGACRLALITRWSGEHHKYFWKLGIDKVLLKLLLNDFHKLYSSEHCIEKIAAAELGLRENYLLVLRPFVWDILGGLAAHCLEDFNPNMHGDEFCMDFLIICACLAFVDSIRQLGQSDISHTFQYESATRTVLMMIYSPSSYIRSHTIFFLYEILKPNGKEYLKRLLDKLNQPRNKLGMLDVLQSVIDLMSLTCYSGLSQYRDYIIRLQGINTLVAFVRWCLTNNVHMRRASVAPHLCSSVLEKTCCWDHSEDWDGNDMPLLFSLWGLSELMHQFTCVKTLPDVVFGQVDCNETEFVGLLQGICSDTSAPGPRWYAAYILSYMGRYGFPSKMGKRIGKVLDDKEFTDLVFIFTDEEPLAVHCIILKVRCPPLLPRSVDEFFVRQDGEKRERPRKEVRLKSDKVDRKALLKLLEFVYSGHLQVGEEVVDKLRGIARHCDLKHLLQILSKENPKWGTPFPTVDLSFALEPAGHHLSDITLVAEGSDIADWTCHTCSVSIPHMHVHRVILSSSSTYFQGMFCSGMQESCSETIIKAPVGWEALVKVVKWFYSAELPKPISGCLWDNLDAKEKLSEMFPYVELCWLAEYWCLGDDLHEYCTRVVISHLDSTQGLSVKLIQIVASFHQKKLVEVVANYMAPLYNHLRKSGELDELDDELVDMIRTASVRLFQEGGHSHT